ncbi:MAG: hypothetical protein MUF74_01770 [Cypionkella sp.]|nr:hypothetical protein [Cypionkella sp.]
MSDRTAFVLAGIILGAALLDSVVNEGRALFFLALKLASLVEWLAFWR